MKTAKKGSLKAFALMLALAAALSGCGREKRTFPFQERVSNSGEIVAVLRNGLKAHAEHITVRFDYGDDVFGELDAAVDAWMEAALEETGRPEEGDYLRYQLGGYTYRRSLAEAGDRYYYTVEITPDYYCSLAQETEASAETRRLLKSFGFLRSTPEETRIRTIYEYICRTVKYDKPHRKHAYYHLRSTAYGAMILHTATCQGYCVSLCRLLKASGIECRIITGKAADEALHAWVIARVNGTWYCLDPTFDAGKETFEYYLAGMEHFRDHEPEVRFLTEEFLKRYPISEKDWTAKR